MGKAFEYEGDHKGKEVDGVEDMIGVFKIVKIEKKCHFDIMEN